VLALALVALPAAARAVVTPEIRTSATNSVPACVTPERLMRFITDRNVALEPRFRDIATHYKRHGDALGIRWDYAFFQMILETNYLMFKRGDGRPGDVRARQNNFAGIGATGGGVPGDSYPDVSTGVLAQMQHLVAYSGEWVASPVAPRTREVQDGVISKSRKLGRPVRFGDLTNRWAADRNYARSIDLVATRFREAHCTAAEPVAAAGDPTGRIVTPPRPADRTRMGVGTMVEPAAARVADVAPPAPPPAPANRKPDCAVMAASFGGDMTLLIRAAGAGRVTLTALEVDRRQERTMADEYMRLHAPGGTIIGRFDTRKDAVLQAWARCDSGRP
jgi:hypothetical protein